MVRFMAEREIENPEEIRKLTDLDILQKRLSSESEYVLNEND